MMGSAWVDLKAELVARRQNWDVWTGWYFARLAGRPAVRKDVEIFRVTLDNFVADGMVSQRKRPERDNAQQEHEADWEQGPAHVNALIKARMAQGAQPKRAPTAPLSVPFQLGPLPSASEQPPNSSPKPSSKARGLARRKPNSPAAKAVSARSGEIRIQIITLSQAIDSRIESLEAQHGLNDASEIEELRFWRCLLAEVDIAVGELENNGEEEKIERIVDVLKEVVIDYIRTHGKATLKLGFRSLIFTSVVSIGAMAGVAWPATLISGVMVGGKPVKDTIVAIWGETKAALGKLPWWRKESEH